MKKTLMILMALVLLLPLSACGNKIKKDNQSAIMEINSESWKKQVKDIPIIQYSGFTESPGLIAQSMEQLKDGENKTVIKGTVYDLAKLNNLDNRVYTRVKVHVDKVISGDKTLINKSINLAMTGGITTTNSWYRNKNQTRETNHEIQVAYQEFPLPKIGGQLIVGLIPTNESEPTDYIRTMKKNNFNFKKTYDIEMPQFNTWIKNPGEREYHLNNPKADRRLAANPKMKQGIEKITLELNQKYND